MSVDIQLSPIIINIRICYGRRENEKCKTTENGRDLCQKCITKTENY